MPSPAGGFLLAGILQEGQPASSDHTGNPRGTRVCGTGSLTRSGAPKGSRLRRVVLRTARPGRRPGPTQPHPSLS